MKAKSDVKILNKKAKFEYIILDRYTAGIVLYGTEIKSLLSPAPLFLLAIFSLR